MALNKARGRDSCEKLGGGGSDGVKGGSGSVKCLPRALQVSCFHSEETDSPKSAPGTRGNACRLLPAQRAPEITPLFGFGSLPPCCRDCVCGGGVRKSYYLAYKRGKRVCPYCEEGN